MLFAPNGRIALELGQAWESKGLNCGLTLDCGARSSLHITLPNCCQCLKSNRRAFLQPPTSMSIGPLALQLRALL